MIAPAPLAPLAPVRIHRERLARYLGDFPEQVGAIRTAIHTGRLEVIPDHPAQLVRTTREPDPREYTVAPAVAEFHLTGDEPREALIAECKRRAGAPTGATVTIPDTPRDRPPVARVHWHTVLPLGRIPLPTARVPR